MGVFDQAGRFAVKRDPQALAAWQAPAFAAKFAFAGWLDTATLVFPGEPERVCDTVAEFALREGEGPRLLLDVEVQSEPDADMVERMAEYAWRLRRERRHGGGKEGKYAVAGLLINLTGPEQERELDMREPTLDGDGPYHRVTQVTMREIDAAATLGEVASGKLSRAVLP